MKAIWVPVSAQVAQEQRVDTLANNIANANTVGFKEDDVPFREYVKEAEHPTTEIDMPKKDFSIEDMYRSPGAHQSYVKAAGSYTNFTQGQLRPTHSELDVALQGPGFFKVKTPLGERYTRNGSFSLNSNNELTTAESGYQILGDNGQPIQFPKSVIGGTHQWFINLNGDILLKDGKPIGKLQIKTTDQLQNMRKEGKNLYSLKENAKELPSTAKVYQGHLEDSNINVIKQMSELISSQRNVEQLQRAISTYDSINGRAVNDLMK